LSGDFETAIRNAVSLGGDTDTAACIAGAIAEAFYGGIPKTIEDEVRCRLDKDLLEVANTFSLRFRRQVSRLSIVPVGG
jgi:ADP-ribosylglycohydrolase